MGSMLEFESGAGRAALRLYIRDTLVFDDLGEIPKRYRTSTSGSSPSAALTIMGIL